MTKLHKKVDWIELFFDLVYVVAIAALTHSAAHQLEHGHIQEHYILFTSIMGVLWWTWSGNTIYADRFKKGDVYYIFFTFVQMALVLFLSLFIDGALKDNVREFSLAYVGIRIVLLALYGRIHLTEPDKRPVTRVFLIGFSLSGFVWFAASFLPAPYALYLWVIGIGVDFFTPFSIKSIIEKVAPADSKHLPERMGLLAMIILGEAIVGVTTGLKGEQLLSDPATFARFFISFGSISLVWFAYFQLSERYLMDKVKGAGHDIIRSHFLIYTGLGMFAEFIHLFTRNHTTPGTLLTLLIISQLFIFCPLTLICRRYGKK